MHKRDFLRTLGSASIGLLLGEHVWAQYATLNAKELAGREDFWSALRARYRLKPDYINLENGYYSMQAEPVLDAFIEKVREINSRRRTTCARRQFDDKAAVRARLADDGRMLPR